MLKSMLGAHCSGRDGEWGEGFALAAAGCSGGYSECRFKARCGNTQDEWEEEQQPRNLETLALGGGQTKLELAEGKMYKH